MSAARNTLSTMAPPLFASATTRSAPCVEAASATARAQRRMDAETQLRTWARQGVTQVDVMCPGFLADCIETLEEIQMQCRDAFLSEGGRRFGFIPCLNDQPDWIAALRDLCRQHLQG